MNTEGNVSGNTGSHYSGTHASDGDDNLFFELSDSSGSSSGVSTPLPIHSSCKTDTVFEPLLHGDNNEGYLNVQQLHASENRRHLSGIPSSSERPDNPVVTFRAAAARIKQHIVTRRESSRRRLSAESTAARSDENHHRGLPTEKAVISSSPLGAPHDEVDDCQQYPAEEMHNMRVEQETRASSATLAGLPQPVHIDLHKTKWEPEAVDTTDGGAENESRSLDLALAMLPRIPSFPPGSAEVWVRVHGILIASKGISPASPPYVRASFYPGARRIARTGLPTVDPTSTTAPNLGFKGSGGVLSATHSPAERFVEYLFGGEDSNADPKNNVLSLPLEPDVVGMMSEKGGRTSPPTMRLEIVSGRSLGRCDLALPEALRRPGGAFLKLQLPVRKKERPQGQARRRAIPGRLPGHQEMTAAEEQGSDEGSIIVGQISLDVGVMLSGEPECSPSGMERGAQELTTGVVIVEAIDICIRDSGGRRVELSGVQRTKFIGIGAALTLGGGKPKLAAFCVGECGRNKPGGNGSESIPVQRGLPNQAGKALLKSSCVELDILSIKLVKREEVDSTTRSCLGLGRMGAEQWQGDRWREGGAGGRGGEGEGRNEVKIAVSDINDIFEGESRWVEMHHEYFKLGCDSRKWGYPGNNAVSGIQTDGFRRSLEVRLRISLADTAPFRQREHQRTISIEGGLSVTDNASPRGSGSAIVPQTERHRTRLAENVYSLPAGGVPRSALEAWNITPGNGCSRARGVFSSQGYHNQGRAVLYSRGDSGYFLSQSGPGVLELEVLAVHGRGKELGLATTIGKEGNGSGSCQASVPDISPPLWVRVTYLCGRRGGRGGREGREGGEVERIGGGGGGVSVTDSPPGDMSPLEQDERWRDGDPAFTARPWKQDREECCRCDWVVRWPRGDGVLARCPVHWTLSQSVLPVVLLEVFRGQVRL